MTVGPACHGVDHCVTSLKALTGITPFKLTWHGNILSSISTLSLRNRTQKLFLAEIRPRVTIKKKRRVTSGGRRGEREREIKKKSGIVGEGESQSSKHGP